MRSMTAVASILFLSAALAPSTTAVAEQDARESLRAAELAFSASVRDQDQEAFASFIADEAIFIAGQVRRGKAAIVEGWSGFFAEGAPRMEWEPEVVEIQEGGELGITRGPYTLTRIGEDGEPVSESGRFASVWRRLEDGSWRVIFDTGCPPCDCG